MVLEKLRDIIRPDATYTYECADCGERFESNVPRERAECPECDGPPIVPETSA